MIISINQPAYLPWLGYFDRIAKSDIHVVLNHVQFEKNSMVNRNKIKNSQGWCWLSVPINKAGKFGDLAINKVTINETNNWQKKHWSSLYFNYKNTPHFGKYAEQLNQFYLTSWDSLDEVLKWQLNFFLHALNINTKILYSSDMSLFQNKSDLILEICQQLKIKQYLSGPFGRKYLEQEKFTTEGVTIKYHDYNHPEYTQHHGDFISHLSIIDLLFNHGCDALKVLSNYSKSE